MALPPYAIPTAEAYDPLTQYPVGSLVGQDTATDVWGCAGGHGLPIANITPYSPTGVGPLGPYRIFRKDITSPDHWAAAQMVIPFDSPDSSVGARMSADGSGYFVSNVSYGGESFNDPVMLKKLHGAEMVGPTPPGWSAEWHGNYYYDTPFLYTPNGGTMYSGMYLFRVNPDGTQDPLVSFSTNGNRVGYITGNEDATFWMVEVVGQNPVTIRVGVLYHKDPDTVFPGQTLPTYPLPLPDAAYGFYELFTYTDSSTKRLTGGAPGLWGGQSSAGTAWGFNAGRVSIGEVVNDSDTSWHIDVPTTGMSGTVTFDAVSSTGETASTSLRIPGPSRLRRGTTDRPPLKISSGASFATAPVRVSTGTDYT